MTDEQIWEDIDVSDEAIEDQHAERQRQHDERIAEINEKIAAAHTRIAELKDEVKELTEVIKDHVEYRRNLLANAPARPDEFVSAGNPIDRSWQDLPTSGLAFDAVRGMGKKISDFVLRCPTLGAVDAMRQSDRGFAQIDGIGPTLAERISAHCQRLVLNGGAMPNQSIDVDMLEGLSPLDILASDGWSMQHVQQALIRQSPRAEDYVPEVDASAFLAGQTARRDGALPSNCPWRDPVRRNDWMRGYMHAQVVSE